MGLRDTLAKMVGVLRKEAKASVRGAVVQQTRQSC